MKLVMPPAATYAFLAINAVAAIRIGAELAPDPGAWQAVAAVGWLLDQRWNGALANGVRVYDASAYRSAFTPMFVTMIVAAFILTLAKDSHAKQMHD